MRRARSGRSKNIPEKRASAAAAKRASRKRSLDEEARLFESLRRPADQAYTEKKFAEARRLYLNCVKETASRKLDLDHRRCLMYAGAGAASMAMGRYLTAITQFRQAFEWLDDKKKLFFPSFNYLSSCLNTLNHYVKKTEQKRRLHDLQSGIFVRFRNCVLSSKPDRVKAAGRPYKLQGFPIEDDFSFLENLQSQETKDWLQKQSDYAQFFISLSLLRYKTPRDYYRSGTAQLSSVPYQIGEYFYFESYENESFHSVLSRAKKYSSKPKIVLSGKQVCPEGYFLAGKRISKDGKYIAYGISKNGSDWEEWKVRNTISGRDIPNFTLQLYGGRVFFHPEGKGLVYWKTKKTNSDKHQIGFVGPQTSIHYRPLHPRAKGAGLVHRAIDPNADYLAVAYSLENKIIVITEGVRQDKKARFYIRSFSEKRRKTLKLFGGVPGIYELLGYLGRKLFFLSSHESTNQKKLITVDLEESRFAIKSTQEMDFGELKQHFAPGDLLITEVQVLRNQLLLNCLTEHSTKSRLLRASYDGKLLEEIKLPFGGIVNSLSSTFDSKHIFYAICNFSTPSTIYHHDLKTGRSDLLIAPSFPPSRDLISKVVEVKSKDGAIVPMWIVHRSSVKPSHKTPALMQVYGGFNLPMLPFYSYQVLAWTAMGGIWAQPYLRGGGELGTSWHEQARKQNKQSTFDDAIACARFLIKHKYSCAKKLAITGSSNGGLTVGAVLTQAPELFGAAIASNGLFDMLKFAGHTTGWAWESEYGSVRKKKEFLAIKDYSPYHNVHKNQILPAVLLCVSAQDDRVPPWHSYKFAAALNAKAACRKPIVLRVEADTGHIGQRSTHEVRDQLAFLKWALDF